MKKYIKTVKGAVGTSIILSAGSGIVQSMGGSTAGLSSMATMMPAAINLEMGKNMLGSMPKIKKKAKKWMN
jgi:hypothetical protein